MLVDDGSGNTPSAPTAPSTPIAPTVPNTPIVLLQDIAEPPRHDDDEPDLTPISGHLAGSPDYPSGQPGNNPLLANNTLEGWMRGPFPPIHDANPVAAFNNIDKAIISAWDDFPTHKLIAIPFGFDVRVHLKHGMITRGLLSAVVNITNSQHIGVSAPVLEDRPIKNRNRTPIAFLVHGLSKDHYIMLLKQRIWVSTDISFRITTTKPSAPDLLFSITELSSLDTGRVHEMVLTIWSRNATIIAIHDIVESFHRDDPSPRPNFRSFLATLKVDCLLIKEKGGRLNPIYNVYANNKYFQNHKLWSQVRSHLAGLTYASGMVGNGLVKTALFHCNVCHGVDHPRGLCAFLKINGWKGPLGLPL
jgi:hypothetical protein